MYFHSQTRTDQARLIPSRSRGRRPQIKNATQIVFGTCAAPSAEVNTNPRRHTLTNTHIALTHSRQGVDKQGRIRGLAWAALRSNWISRLGRNMQKKEGLAKESLVAGWPCGRMVAADFTLATRETCNTHTRLPLGAVGFAFLISTWQHFCSNRC